MVTKREINVTGTVFLETVFPTLSLLVKPTLGSLVTEERFECTELSASARI